MFWGSTEKILLLKITEKIEGLREIQNSGSESNWKSILGTVRHVVLEITFGTHVSYYMIGGLSKFRNWFWRTIGEIYAPPSRGKWRTEVSDVSAKWNIENPKFKVHVPHMCNFSSTILCKTEIKLLKLIEAFIKCIDLWLSSMIAIEFRYHNYFNSAIGQLNLILIHLVYIRVLFDQQKIKTGNSLYYLINIEGKDTSAKFSSG